MSMKKKPMVRLLRYIDGAWRVIDYGIPSKAAIYAAMGYVVEFSPQGVAK